MVKNISVKWLSLLTLVVSLALVGCPEGPNDLESITAVAGVDQVVLPNIRVSLDAADSEGAILAYTWSFETVPLGSSITDSDIEQGEQASFTPDVGGTYVLSLTVSNGTVNDTDTVIISVDRAPRAITSKTSIITQINEVVTLDGSSSTDEDLDNLTGEVLSYSWDLGDGTTETGAVVRHTYTVSDVYLSTLTVTDSMGLSHTKTIYVIVDDQDNAAPTADAGVNILRYKSDEIVRFDASASKDPEGADLVYSWDFGDGSNSADLSPNHKYERGDIFVVTLTVTDDNSQSDEDQIVAVINQVPTAVAKIIDDGRELDSITIDTNYELTFDASKSSDIEGDLFSYEWDMGNGQVFNEEEVTFVYETPGIYTVILTVSDSGGAEASVSVEVTVNNQPPVAGLSGNINTEWIDGGVTLDFNSGLCSDPEGSALTYSWDFESDGIVDSTESNPSHTFSDPGSYKVSLTVSDGFLTDSVEQYVIIADIYNADGIPPEPVLTLQAQDPLIDEVLGDSVGVSNYTIYVLEGSPTVFDALRSYDPGGLQTGIDANAVLTYLWDFDTSDTLDSNETTAVAGFTYTDAGTYTAQCTVTDDEGSTATIDITVNVLVSPNKYPKANAGTNQTLTLGYQMVDDEPLIDSSITVNFDGSESSDPDGSLVNYTWDFGDDTNNEVSTTTAMSHDYEAPGTYLVTLTVEDDGKENLSGNCYLAKTDRDTMAVIVKNPYINSSPVADVGAQNVQVITGEPVYFDASGSFDPNGSITNYSWDMTTGVTQTATKFSYTFDTAGTYTTVLTVMDNDGATTTMEKIVEVVDPSPIAFRLDVSYSGTELFNDDNPLFIYIVNLSDTDWMTKDPEAVKRISNYGIYAIKVSDLVNEYDETNHYAFLVVHDVTGTATAEGNYWGFYQDGAPAGFGTSASTATSIEKGQDTGYSMEFTDSNKADLSVSVW